MHTSQVQLVDTGLVRGHDVELLLRQGDDLLHLGEQALGLVGGGVGALKKKKTYVNIRVHVVRIVFSQVLSSSSFAEAGGDSHRIP